MGFELVLAVVSIPGMYVKSYDLDKSVDTT